MPEEPFTLTDEYQEHFLVRPDGSRLIGFGWAGIVVGLLSWMIALVIPTNTYDSHWPEKFAVVMFGCGVGALALTLLLAGLIIRSLYFISGDVMKARGSTHEAREKQRLVEKHAGLVAAAQAAKAAE